MNDLLIDNCKKIEQSRKEHSEKWLIQDHLHKIYKAQEFLKKSVFYTEEENRKYSSIFD